MGYSIEECDRSCPLCGDKMDEIWGDHGGNCYYFDECRQCGIHIVFGFIDWDRYYVGDILDGISYLIQDWKLKWKGKRKNKWNKDYEYLLPYLELFK